MTLHNFLERYVWVRPPRPPKPIPPGVHHYMREAGGAYIRFHLRVEPDGTGMLLANASVAARLSPVGVVIATGLLEREAEHAILEKVAASFRRASRQVMRADLDQIKTLIGGLASPEDNYPIINLDDAAVVSRPTRLIAPLNADVLLAEPERTVPIIDRLWAAGIPHLTLVVPENPNAAHLVRAVERAEDTGMIAGVRGRASDLLGGTLLKDLAQAGVDHVNVFHASAQRAVHDALFGAGDFEAAQQVIAQTQELEVCPVAIVPLVETTVGELGDTLAAVHQLGVTNVAFFALAAPDEMPAEQRGDALTASALPQVAALVEGAAHEAQVRYLWQPPVSRNPAVPLAVQVRRGPRCFDDVSMRVEPDGAVIPPRGPYRAAGNLLTDSWAAIWGHAEFRRYRERVETPTRCDVCPGLAICAADCPREPAGWSQDFAGGEGR